MVFKRGVNMAIYIIEFKSNDKKIHEATVKLAKETTSKGIGVVSATNKKVSDTVSVVTFNYNAPIGGYVFKKVVFKEIKNSFKKQDPELKVRIIERSIKERVKGKLGIGEDKKSNKSKSKGNK